MIAKRMLALLLVILLSNVAAGAPYAAQTGNQSPTIAERTRRCAVRLSTQGRRRNQRIGVRLRDGSRLRGYVGLAEDSHFTIINSRSGQATSVPYEEVTDLRCGPSFSGELAKGAIVLGVAIGGLMLLGLYVVSQTR